MGRRVVRLTIVLAVVGTLLAVAPAALAEDETIEFASATGSVDEDVPGGTYTVNAVLDTGPGGPATSEDEVSVTVSAPSDPDDYTLNTTTVTFPEGSADGSTIAVSVTIVDDPRDEADQPVVLTLSGDGAGSLDTHTVTILDDDPLPVLSISSESEDEGDGLTFTITKSGPTERTVSVSYATAPDTTGLNPATAGVDYTAVPTTPVTPFGPSDTTRTITIASTEDTLSEADETFLVPLSAPTNATLAGDGGATGTGTILDDDAPPGLSVASAPAVQEGTSLEFTVSLTPASGRVVTVDYATKDGTAKAPGDYTSTSDTLTFAVGETTKTVTVPTKADTVDEIDETLTLELSDPTNSTIAAGAGTATGTIKEDPADNKPPVIDKILITDSNGVPKTTFRRGETVKVNVEFSDPGVADSHQWIVSWQDGTDDNFATIKGSGSVKRSFSVTHQYVAIAPQTITVIINDGEGGTDRKDAITIVITGAGGSALETVGLVDPASGRWYLRNSVGEVTSFFYGNPGDFPIVGDWDCDGSETPGMYRQSDGFVYLRNSNTQGVADIRFFFGNPGDIPIVGDFNGNGCDTVSIYRPSQSKVFVINKLGANEGGLGAAEIDYFFGNPGDKPFVGDFDGDSTETIGLHRESTGLVYFRNSHTQGTADNEFIFGDPDDRLVAGDWIQKGIDYPAVFRPSLTTFFFRHSNTQGVADNQFVFGESSYLPVAGNFGLG